ncbi:MAG: hypothetical protein ACM3X0_04190 [Bacteroidota bacterium]
MRNLLIAGVFVVSCNGCAVVAVADAAVTVAATTVKVGATVVETTVDVAASGVKAVTGSSDEKK